MPAAGPTAVLPGLAERWAQEAARARGAVSIPAARRARSVRPARRPAGVARAERIRDVAAAWAAGHRAAARSSSLRSRCSHRCAAEARGAAPDDAAPPSVNDVDRQVRSAYLQNGTHSLLPPMAGLPQLSWS